MRKSAGDCPDKAAMIADLTETSTAFLKQGTTLCSLSCAHSFLRRFHSATEGAVLRYRIVVVSIQQETMGSTKAINILI